ncbi:hypothetical protein BBJ28_00008242 [Nothophytophthora sp. Chile5]|nr:hypothetical protein BBJ28_00008242 [Nothophytophthora sp. Chile5]
MMEPAASSTASVAVPAAAAPGVAAAPAPIPGSALLRQLSTQISQVQVPKVIKDRTDELERRISTTDIARINGYMRLVNLVFAGGLWVTCFIRMFEVPSYSHFLVIIYIMCVGRSFLSAGLAFIENHERFPSVADRVKVNFGFMFSAFGKASYIMWCPTGANTTAKQQEEADLEAMPELRYNQPQAQVPAMATASAASKSQPSHVSV